MAAPPRELIVGMHMSDEPTDVLPAWRFCVEWDAAVRTLSDLRVHLVQVHLKLPISRRAIDTCPGPFLWRRVSGPTDPNEKYALEKDKAPVMLLSYKAEHAAANSWFVTQNQCPPVVLTFVLPDGSAALLDAAARTTLSDVKAAPETRSGSTPSSAPQALPMNPPEKRLAVDDQKDYMSCLDLWTSYVNSKSVRQNRDRSGDALVIRAAYSNTAARKELLSKVVGVDFMPGCFPVSKVPETLFAQLRTATQEVASTNASVVAVQPIVQDILTDIANQCGNGLSVVRCEGNVGVSHYLKISGKSEQKDADIEREDADLKYNPDHVVYHIVNEKPVVDLIVDSKEKGSMNEPWEATGKLLRDMEYVAKLSDKVHMVGLIISQTTARFFQLFRVPDDFFALQYKDVPTANAREITFMCAHAMRRGTLLDQTASDGPSSDNPWRFTSFLGRGRTSIVFRTASARWPVAKVLTSLADRNALAENEVRSIDALFTSDKVQNVDHFMDATLDPSRDPRRTPHSAAEAAVQAAAQPVTALREGGTAPASRRIGAPVIFYSRLCKLVPANYFASSAHDFAGRLSQLLDACRQMHYGEIVHNDLRLDNLMIDGDTLVLGDFGYSQPRAVQSVWMGGSIVTASLNLLQALQFRAHGFQLRSPTYDFQTSDDLWSVMALCLYADSQHAEDLGRVAAAYFQANNRTTASVILRSMWDLWATYDLNKWGAAVSIMDDAGTSDDWTLERLLTALQQVLERPSRRPIAGTRVKRSRNL